MASAKVQFVVEVDAAKGSAALRAINKGLKEVDASAKKAKTSTKGWASATTQAEKAAGGLASRLGPLGGMMSSFGPTGLVAAAGVGALTVALAGAAAAGQKGLQMYAVQDQAVRSLNVSLSNQGRFSAEASIGLQDYAAQMQKVTTYGDEQIISAQAQLIQFGLMDDQLRRSIPVVLDFAAATGRNLKDAATAVGKAAAGQTDVLREMGITVDKSRPPLEQFEQALYELDKRFGGQAQEQAKTFAGSLKQIGAAAGDVWEKLGQLETFVAGKFGVNFKGVILTALDLVSGAFDHLASIVVGVEAAFYGAMEAAAHLANAFSGVPQKALAMVPGGQLISGVIGGLSDSGRGPEYWGSKREGALQWDEFRRREKLKGGDTGSGTGSGAPPPPPPPPPAAKAGKWTPGTAVMPGEFLDASSRAKSVADTIVAGVIADATAAVFAGMDESARNAGLGPAETFAVPQGVMDAAVANQERINAELAKRKTTMGEVVEETYNWADGLQTIANMVSGTGVLGSALGGVLGGVAGIGATLQDQGGLSGLWGKLKGGSGTGGFIAGLTGAGSIAGAAVSIGKGIVGLFKKSPVEKAQEQIGKALGEKVSESFAEEVMARAEQTGKSLSTVARELKAEAERAKRQAGFDELWEAQEQRQAGVSRAAGSVDKWAAGPATKDAALMWSTTFWAAVGELGYPEALKAFKGTFENMKDVLPDDVASLFSKMSEEGSPLMATAEQAKALADNVAGLASSQYLTADAFGASQRMAQQYYASALGQTEDEKQALLAIAPLLGNINRLHKEAGLALDDNTAGLIAQAQAAGIAFPIDPMLRMVEVLEAIAAKMGAIATNAQAAGGAISGIRPPSGFGSAIHGEFNPDWGDPYYTAARGLGPVRLSRDMWIRAHAGEAHMVIPKDEVYKHAARGLYNETDPEDWTKGGPGGGYVPPSAPTPPPVVVVTPPVVVTQTAEQVVQQMMPMIVAKMADVAKPQVNHTDATSITINADAMRTREGQEEHTRQLMRGATKMLERNTDGVRSRWAQLLKGEAL